MAAPPRAPGSPGMTSPARPAPRTWRGRAVLRLRSTVASFIGFVPASHPQLLVAGVVDEPQQGSIYGGSVAAPAFQKIVGWAVPYLGISPR